MKRLLPLLLFLLSGTIYAQYEDSSSSPVTLDDYSNVTEETQSEPTFYTQPDELPTTRKYKSESINTRKFDQKKWKEVTGSADFDRRGAKRRNKSGSNENESTNSENNGNSGSGSSGDYRQSEEDAQNDRRNKMQDDRYEHDEGDDYDNSADDESESSSDNLSTGAWGGEWITIIFYTMIIVVIGIIVFFVLKNISFKSNPKNTTTPVDDHTANVEDISILDVDTPLDKAVKAGNYRLAVRLYFLGLLKKLNETELIIWKKDKTNRDYLSELYAKARYYEEVRKLTLAYEQVWYGDHAIPAEEFQQIKREFLAVDQQINTTVGREKN